MEYLKLNGFGPFRWNWSVDGHPCEYGFDLFAYIYVNIIDI